MDEIKDRLERIEGKQDKIQENMAEMVVVLTKNTADIAHHIQRSDLAEENLELLREDLKPIKHHVEFVKGALWAIGVVGAFAYVLKDFGIFEKLF